VSSVSTRLLYPIKPIYIVVCDKEAVGADRKVDVAEVYIARGKRYEVGDGLGRVVCKYHDKMASIARHKRGLIDEADD
jgi:hypothetical protein